MKQAPCPVPANRPLVEFTGTDDSAAGTGFRICGIRSGVKHNGQITNLFLCLITNR